MPAAGGMAAISLQKGVQQVASPNFEDSPAAFAVNGDVFSGLWATRQIER
jgi:hypothetical protein